MNRINNWQSWFRFEWKIFGDSESILDNIKEQWKLLNTDFTNKKICIEFLAHNVILSDSQTILENNLNYLKPYITQSLSPLDKW